MNQSFPGRYTARADPGTVVFGIGMRVNRLWAVHRWLRPTINTARMWWYMQHDRPDGYLNGYLYVYWHETYRIEPGGYEAIYGSMPRFGLAAAGEHIPIADATHAARSRLTGQSEATPPIPSSERHHPDWQVRTGESG